MPQPGSARPQRRGFDGGGLPVDIGQQHVRAFAHEHAGDRRPDSRSRAGDQRHFAVQSHGLTYYATARRRCAVLRSTPIANMAPTTTKAT